MLLHISAFMDLTTLNQYSFAECVFSGFGQGLAVIDDDEPGNFDFRTGLAGHFRAGLAGVVANAHVCPRVKKNRRE